MFLQFQPKFVQLISLVENSDRKNCEIAKEFHIPPNTLPSIIKQIDTILMFNHRNMIKIGMNIYLDMDKCLLH